MVSPGEKDGGGKVPSASCHAGSGLQKTAVRASYSHITFTPDTRAAGDRNNTKT